MAAARLGVADTALSQPAVGQSPLESRARTGSASTASSFHSEDSVSGRGRVSSMARSSDVALRRLWRGSRRASATADELQSLGQDFTVAAKTFESEATAEPKTVAGKCWRWFTQKHHPTQVTAYNHGLLRWPRCSPDVCGVVWSLACARGLQGFRVRWDIASMLVLLFCLVGACVPARRGAVLSPCLITYVGALPRLSMADFVGPRRSTWSYGVAVAAQLALLTVRVMPPDPVPRSL